MQTFADSSVEVGDYHYCKPCIKCVECGRGPSEDTPMMLGPRQTDSVFEQEQLDPFCKFCFAKRYKLSALNVAESVKIL